MTQPKPNHACTARNAPFPVHGGEYTSTGRDLERVESKVAAASAPIAEPVAAHADTDAETDHAARRGKKREENSRG